MIAISELSADNSNGLDRIPKLLQLVERCLNPPSIGLRRLPSAREQRFVEEDVDAAERHGDL